MAMDGSLGYNTSVGTDAAGVARSQSDESAFSPASSPGVLDLPVAANDTDKEHGVVDG